jgi:hypothetical protein
MSCSEYAQSLCVLAAIVWTRVLTCEQRAALLQQVPPPHKDRRECAQVNAENNTNVRARL